MEDDAVDPDMLFPLVPASPGFMPACINGHDVIAAFPTPKRPATRAGFVICVRRDGHHAPYVTAWIGRDGKHVDKSWWSGSYFTDEREALANFIDRCKRGY